MQASLSWLPAKTVTSNKAVDSNQATVGASTELIQYRPTKSSWGGSGPPDPPACRSRSEGRACHSIPQSTPASRKTGGRTAADFAVVAEATKIWTPNRPLVKYSPSCRCGESIVEDEQSSHVEQRCPLKQQRNRSWG